MSNSPKTRLPEERSLDGIRLLIVEDDRDSREMLCELLRMQGAECWEAEDVPAAREALSEMTPDAVLSDIGLPGEDGYALLRWVRARAEPIPPVIAVSAYELKDWRVAGFATYIRKPIDVGRMIRTLTEVVSERSSVLTAARDAKRRLGAGDRTV